jgi:hypothetical protein
MPVGVQLDFPGVTFEKYDEVVETMGYLAGGAGPPGMLFHWVTKTDAGTRVIDVWDTRDGFEAFAADKILPAFREGGVLNPPTIQFYEVHKYLVGSRWRH